MPAFGRQPEKNHGAGLLNKTPTDNMEDAPADDTPWFTIARSSVRRKLCLDLQSQTKPAANAAGFACSTT